MAVVWARGEVVAEDVAAALGGRLKNATVRTILRRVEDKGYLTHRRDGRVYVYTPRLDADAAARGAVRKVMDRFYGGSVERLLVGLLDGQMISGDQLDELRTRLREAQETADPSGRARPAPTGGRR